MNARRLLLPVLVLLLSACARAPRQFAQPAPPSPLGITLQELRIETCVGLSQFLSSVVSWAEAPGPVPEGPPVISYRSLHPEIASVTNRGEITPLAAGRAVIEVRAELAGLRATTHGELIVREGRVDAQATRQSGQLTCGR